MHSVKLKDVVDINILKRPKTLKTQNFIVPELCMIQ